MSVLVCYCTVLLISQGQISSVIYLNAVAYELVRFAFAYLPRCAVGCVHRGDRLVVVICVNDSMRTDVPEMSNNSSKWSTLQATPPLST